MKIKVLICLMFIGLYGAYSQKSIKIESYEGVLKGVEDSTVFSMKDSLYHGEARTYRKEKGITYLFMLCNYFKGVKNGHSFSYRMDGSLMSESYYKNNLLNGIKVVYYSNSNIKESGEYKKGAQNGLWRSFNEKGSLKELSHYSGGYLKGRLIKYYNSGNISMEGSYKLIKRKEKISTTDCNPMDDSNNKEYFIKEVTYDWFETGKWCFYKENGDIIKCVKYRKGEIVKTF